MTDDYAVPAYATKPLTDEIDRLTAEVAQLRGNLKGFKQAVRRRDIENTKLRTALEYAIAWIENGDTDIEKQCANKLRAALNEETK